MGPVTSYYVIVGNVALSEQERVDAGIASSPTGYWKGKPVLSAEKNMESMDSMALKVMRIQRIYRNDDDDDDDHHHHHQHHQ